MNIKISIFILLCSIGILSCYKTPTYPVEPAIEFVSYNVNQPYIVGDTGIIRLSFTDGDGDIGNASSSSTDSNCFVYKSFVPGFLYPYVIPFIPKKGTTPGISGFIDLKLSSPKGGLFDPTSCLVLKHPLDTVTFTIQIKDRAGHLSNTINTPPLVVQCP